MASFLIQALPWAGVSPPPEQQMVSGVLGEAAEGDWEGLTAPDPWSPSFPSSKSQDGASLSLLLLLLSHFSRVRLYVTPETAAHQAPLSLGFSRQEHWSGSPFLSPMHVSEK